MEQLKELDNTMELFMDLSIPYLLQSQVQILIDYLIYRFELLDRYAELVLINSIVYHATPYFGKVIKLMKLDQNSDCNVYKSKDIDAQNGISRALFIKLTIKAFGLYKRIFETLHRLVIKRNREDKNTQYIALFNVINIAYIEECRNSFEDADVTFIINNYVNALKHPQQVRYYNAQVISLCLLASKIDLTVPVQSTVISVTLHSVLENILASSQLTFKLRSTFRDSMMVVLLILQNQKVRLGHLPNDTVGLFFNVMAKYPGLATFIQVETKNTVPNYIRFCKLIFTSFIRYVKTIASENVNEDKVKELVKVFISFFSSLKKSSHYMRYILLSLIDELHIISNTSRTYDEQLFKIDPSTNLGVVNSKHSLSCLIFKHVLLTLQKMHPVLLNDTLTRHVFNTQGPIGSVDVFAFICFCLADGCPNRFLVNLHRYLNRCIEHEIPSNVEASNLGDFIGLYLEPLLNPQLRSQLYHVLVKALVDAGEMERGGNSHVLVSEFFKESLKDPTLANQMYANKALWKSISKDVACRLICDHIGNLLHTIDMPNIKLGVVSDPRGMQVDSDPFLVTCVKTITGCKQLENALVLYCDLYESADPETRQYMSHIGYHFMAMLASTREIDTNIVLGEVFDRCFKVLNCEKHQGTGEKFTRARALIDIFLRILDTNEVTDEHIPTEQSNGISSDTQGTIPRDTIWWNGFLLCHVLYGLCDLFCKDKNEHAYNIGILLSSLAVRNYKNKVMLPQFDGVLKYLPCFMEAMTRTREMRGTHANHIFVLEHLHVIFQNEQLLKNFKNGLKDSSAFWLPYCFEICRIYKEFLSGHISNSNALAILTDSEISTTKTSDIIVFDPNAASCLIDNVFNNVSVGGGSVNPIDTNFNATGTTADAVNNTDTIPLLVLDSDISRMFNNAMDSLGSVFVILGPLGKLNLIDLLLHLVEFITSDIPNVRKKSLGSLLNAFDFIEKSGIDGFKLDTQCCLDCINHFDGVITTNSFENSNTCLEYISKRILKKKLSDVSNLFTACICENVNLGWLLLLYALANGSRILLTPRLFDIFTSNIHDETNAPNYQILGKLAMHLIQLLIRNTNQEHLNGIVDLLTIVMATILKADISFKQVFEEYKHDPIIKLIGLLVHFGNVSTEKEGSQHLFKGIKNCTMTMLYTLRKGQFWLFDDAAKFAIVDAITQLNEHLDGTRRFIVSTWIFAVTKDTQKHSAEFTKQVYTRCYKRPMYETIVSTIVSGIDSLKTLEKIYEATISSKLAPELIVNLSYLIMSKLIIGTSMAIKNVQQFVSSATQGLVGFACAHLEPRVEVTVAQYFNVLYQTMERLSGENTLSPELGIQAFDCLVQFLKSTCAQSFDRAMDYMVPLLKNLILSSRRTNPEFPLTTILDIYSCDDFNSKYCIGIKRTLRQLTGHAELHDEWLAACILKCTEYITDSKLLKDTCLDLTLQSQNTVRVATILLWFLVEMTNSRV
ncbi:Armadillo-type fold, partial [Babesia duncani]